MPTILEVMSHITGMGLTAVARVTDHSWTACAVRDEIAFGLRAGDELDLETTICDEIRQHGQPVAFGSASADPRYREHVTPRLYGFESYVSIPIVRLDGTFFGTLCGIAREPADPLAADTLHTLEFFAQLIAAQLEAQEASDRDACALAAATDATQRLERENRRIARLMREREAAEQAVTLELKDTRRLRDVAALVAIPGEGDRLFDEILDAAIDILDADAGTIQLLDPATQSLRFLATRGFGPDIVAHFANVDASSGSPCGAALSSGQHAFMVFDPAAPDPDGSTRWHLDAGMRSAQSTPLVSRSGQPLGMFSTHWHVRRSLGERDLRFLDLLGRQAADLIEHRQQQQALAASERRLREEARRKDEFIAVLAHELRNPLAPIRSGVELLRRTSDPLIERVRPMMERQVRHMVRLIDDLLDVARISSGKVELRREPVTLERLVDGAVEPHRGTVAASGIALDVELDDPDRVLDVDPTRLSQVLSNVIHNAAKFTPPGGRIAVAATLARPGAGTPAQQVIRISDTGAGIRPELLPTIFELFTQLRPDSPEDSASRHGGMGIGLALARSLVELHGGTIGADSAGPGRGTTFTIRIPVASSRSPPASDEPHDASDGRLDMRVLVVDDNRDAADALGMLLSQHGAQVHVAYGAQDSVATTRRFQPALALLDLGMPDVDGYEACRRIRGELGPDLRVFALTGWGQDEDRRNTVEAGFDAHLTKPVDIVRLIELATALVPGARVEHNL
ncbi:MAG TPA: ATP-binding protein [Burkholderiaceae bacterium]